MKKLFFALALMSFLSLPAPALAMKGHDQHHTAPAKAQMPTGEHMGMEMGDMLGVATVEGVKAMAHIKDVKAEMAKHGMKATHHFAVAFEDAQGKTIEQGRVAVRVTGPDGKTTAAISLPGMDGHFGTDLELAAPGSYTFLVGTRLADDTVRQFSFGYEVR